MHLIILFNPSDADIINIDEKQYKYLAFASNIVINSVIPISVNIIIFDFLLNVHSINISNHVVCITKWK